jgi:uncharacterized membrane protein
MRIPLRLSLAKTGSFALLHFTVAFSIAYLLTGSIGVASVLALIEPLANTVAFFFHERAWSRVTHRSGGVGDGETSLASASK